MLYIKHSLLLLILSTHVGFAQLAQTFDASKSSELPERGVVFTRGPDANVEVADKKLRITTGSGTNSARAALAMPPQASLPAKVREIELDFEPFAGRSADFDGVAGLWTGFVASGEGTQKILTVAGNWLGLVIEVREVLGGKYAVVLRERWALGDAGVAYLDQGIGGDSALHTLCELTNCPTRIKLIVKNEMVRVSFTGAGISEVAPGVLRGNGGDEVEKPIQPEMEEILNGNLEAVFGLANYGETQGSTSLLLNRFSIKQ
jgi:hypothetical protein